MMLTMLIAWLNRYATPRRLAWVGSCVVVLLAALNSVNLPFFVPDLRALSGGLGPLDARFWYDAQVVTLTLTALGEHGRAHYGWFLVAIDSWLPMAYTLALLWAWHLARVSVLGHGHAGWRWVYALPLLGMVLDYLENVMTSLLLIAFPGQPWGLASVLGYVTAGKYVASGVALVLTLVFAVRGWSGRRVTPDGANA
ncbi:hypothetical protein [Chitinivorax sp. B]|uniref:hypothetical protein n=1 Tax=Chitinivorax sp. B TaxID=2502235 RepID=UPI0010F6701F|nr:hypothetical protein [Chitinivorax sp. B]